MNSNKFIKCCCFCNMEFVKTEVIKMKKDICLDNDNKLRTVVNENIIRCNKCKNCFSCQNCKDKIAEHYELCLGDNISPALIITDIEYDKEFEFILLPDKLGGHVANVYNITRCEDFKIYKFIETKYILLKLLESNSCCWIKESNNIKFLNMYKVNMSVGEAICNNVLHSMQFNNKEVGYYEFKKKRPIWLRCSYSNFPLELDLFNEELKLAVEYNGQQHYKYVQFFHQNEEAFKKQLQRDEEKMTTCLKFGINLIIVPYTLKTYKLIEQFIKSKL